MDTALALFSETVHVHINVSCYRLKGGEGSNTTRAAIIMMNLLMILMILLLVKQLVNRGEEGGQKTVHNVSYARFGQTRI